MEPGKVARESRELTRIGQGMLSERVDFIACKFAFIRVIRGQIGNDTTPAIPFVGVLR